jgi:aminoglycoside phosphotransferase (APT) family kinase protein
MGGPPSALGRTDRAPEISVANPALWARCTLRGGPLIDSFSFMDRGEQLLATLSAHLDRAEVRFSEALHPLEGGYSNEIFRFRLEQPPSPFDQPLVLRLTHDERDTAREGIIENGVAEQGFRAPPVLLRGGSSSAFGRPFLVTPLSPGVSFGETITARTAIGVFRRLPDQLAASMVVLHRVPTEGITARLTAEGWEPDRLDSLAVLADVDDYAEQANSSDLRRRASVLRKNQPSFARPVVCHGDLHPFNLLFEGREVTIILDWELARLADPAYDVGRTLVLLRLAPYPMSRITRSVIQPLATALARGFERRYRERNQLDELNVRWHEALHCLRTLALVEVGATRQSGSRLRRTADVWLPVASRLEHRFAAITKQW